MSDHFRIERELAAAVRRFLENTSGEASEAMAALTSATDRVPLGKLDVWERTIRQKLAAAHVEQSSSAWKFWRRPARIASWLDLCSADGRKREAILRAVNGPAPNGLFLAFAVRRLNDWVPQVRAAARKHLPRIASASDPEHVADALWAVLAHCGSWGRMEDSDRQILSELIALEQSALALETRVLTAAAGPAPTVFAQAAQTRAFDPWLEEIAQLAVQPAVRAKAYRFLLEGRVRWVAGRKWRWVDVTRGQGRFEPVIEERKLVVDRPMQVLVSQALRDPSAMVRRVGADALIQHLASLGADAPVLAQQIAADPCASVAERGRFALAKLGERGAEPSDT
jgi:hypothetical protein